MQKWLASDYAHNSPSSGDREHDSLVAVDGNGTTMSTERHGQLALHVVALVGRGEVRRRLVRLGARRLREAFEDGSCKADRVSGEL